MNESYVPPQRKFSILDRTEAGLLQARAAIREARNWNQTQDLDYVPIGPMYRNAKAFHRYLMHCIILSMLNLDPLTYQVSNLPLLFIMGNYKYAEEYHKWATAILSISQSYS